MCFRLFRRKRDNKNDEHTLPKPIQYYGDLKEDSKNYTYIYYSPNCTRRPNHCKRICINCNKHFYSYDKEQYCSNECDISDTITASANVT